MNTLIPQNIIDAILQPLRETYTTEGRRFYHTYQHAIDVHDRVLATGSVVTLYRPVETLLAALYHDVIYIAGNGNNEHLSALRAIQDLKPFKRVDRERVFLLIEYTALHFHMHSHQIDDDRDAAILMDADIAGFADPWDRFKEQNHNIEREFVEVAGVKLEDYYMGRRAFLEGLMQRQIFRSQYFRDVYEQRARDNIKHALDELPIVTPQAG